MLQHAPCVRPAALGLYHLSLLVLCLATVTGKYLILSILEGLSPNRRGHCLQLGLRINSWVPNRATQSCVYGNRNTFRMYLVSPRFPPQVSGSVPRRRSLLMSSNDPNNPYYKGMDAYQILGIPRDADKKTIKAAYRKGERTSVLLVFVPSVILCAR